MNVSPKWGSIHIYIHMYYIRHTQEVKIRSERRKIRRKRRGRDGCNGGGARYTYRFLEHVITYSISF